MKLNPLRSGVLRAIRSKQQPLDLHAPLYARGREAVLGQQTITCLERLAAAEGGGVNLVLAYKLALADSD